MCNANPRGVAMYFLAGDGDKLRPVNNGGGGVEAKPKLSKLRLMVCWAPPNEDLGTPTKISKTY